MGVVAAVGIVLLVRFFSLSSPPAQRVLIDGQEQDLVRGDESLRRWRIVRREGDAAVHGDRLAQFSASPDLHSEFVTAVIGAMDSSADLSAQILNNPDLSQKLLAELVPIIYKRLKATA